LGKISVKKLFAILISLCVIFLSSCADGSSSTAAPNESSKTSTQPESETSSETAQKEIYSDDLISMSFVGVQDMPSLKGMFLLNVKAKNNSDKKITVYLKDVSINGNMIQMTSGIPNDIMPLKQSACSFSGKDSTVEISSASEIKEIEFKIYLTDESTHVIETTNPIKINL
jgi:outer membrane lipoprotein-sorting protein